MSDIPSQIKNFPFNKDYITILISIFAFIASSVSAYVSRRTYYFNTFDKLFPLYKEFRLEFGKLIKRNYVNEYDIKKMFYDQNGRIYKNENLIRQCSIIFSSPNNGDNIIKYGLDMKKQSTTESYKKERLNSYSVVFSGEIDTSPEKIHEIRKEINILKKQIEKITEEHSDKYTQPNIGSERYSLSCLENTYKNVGDIKKIKSEIHNAFLKKIICERLFKIEFDYLTSRIDIKIKHGGNLLKYTLSVQYCFFKYRWQKLHLNLKRILSIFKGKPVL